MYLVGLFLLVDFVTRLDKFLEAKAEIEKTGRTLAGAMLQYYAAGVPLIVLQVAPFVTVMGACMALVDLRRWNELYPMMESGRSLARILAPVVAFSALLTAVLVVAHDGLAPLAVQARIEVERAMENDVGHVTYRLPHVRDGAGNTWSIYGWDPVAEVAEGARSAPFKAKGRTYDLLEIPKMTWRKTEGAPGGWFPEKGRLFLPAGDRPGGSDTVLEVPSDRAVPTDITPSDIELARASEDIEGLSTSGLRRLRDRHPGLPYLSVLLYRRITYPLANLILLLVGVPLVLRGEGASLFLSVLAALGVCAGYFVFDSIACDLGGRGVLPAGVATWLATIAFGAAGVTLMDAARGQAPPR
jgi:lipopolysaccharide export system permease protein